MRTDLERVRMKRDRGADDNELGFSTGLVIEEGGDLESGLRIEIAEVLRVMSLALRLRR